MKKLIVFIAVACLLALRPVADSVTVKTVPQIQSANVGAKAAIVMEPVTGRVLFAQNAEERLPMASTTKIMTALIALEQPDIDAVFPVDGTAITVEGSSMGLQKGDKASLRALATGMLLASGNDAANAAAVRISGSIPAFVKRMNERALSMGLKNTSFETPSGLDGDLHYTTARDLAVITREAIQNEDFARICSQYKMRTAFGNPPYDRWLTNHNKLLNYYEGAFGVKTGFTKKAGRCLVSAAKRDGVDLICVTLGCPNDWNVHKSLYERFFAEIEIADLSKGIPKLKVPVTGGVVKNVAAEKCDLAQIPVPAKGARVEYEISVEPFVYAPVKKGQYLGEARILLDGEEIYSVTLAAGENVNAVHAYKEEKSLFDTVKKILGLDE